MGYSHRYMQSKSFKTDEWRTVLTESAAILKACTQAGVALGDWRGDPTNAREILGEFEICFNGLGDEACETFTINRVKPRNHRLTGIPGKYGDYVKTNRLPYDLAVVAILTYFAAAWPDHIEVDSDGTSPDFESGTRIAANAIPRIAQVINEAWEEVNQ